MLVPSFPFKQAAMATPLLGMLFFSIYTNNIPSVVTKASINMYADDTALYASHSNAITAAKVVSDDQVLASLTKLVLYNILHYTKPLSNDMI